MVVDSHLHVWDLARPGYEFLVGHELLPRRFVVADVASELDRAGVDRVVLVQAADTTDDTELMLEVARTDDRVAGVVGWVPMLRPDLADATLERWSTRPIVGVRHMVHRDPDPDLLRRPEVGETLELLAGRGLAFDVCAETPHLLGLVPEMADRHPHLTFVVDHLGKPPIRDAGWQPWADLLAAAAAAPNVVAKLSGLNTAAEPGAGHLAFQPYVDHALEVFGPERLMYGGDWPFARFGSPDYTHVWTDLLATIAGLDPGAREQVLSGTATRVYRLG